jgi:hypothetical protein
VEPSASPQATEKAILAVLAGTPLRQAAASILTDPADLADAMELYQAAGYAALQAQAAPGGWYQVRIQFADWDTAEHAVAAHLWPELQRAETAGIISPWWFIRKAPCWRLRCQTAPAALSADMKAHVGRALDGMLSRCQITRWQESIYEPERYAFGCVAGDVCCLGDDHGHRLAVPVDLVRVEVGHAGRRRAEVATGYVLRTGVLHPRRVLVSDHCDDAREG